MKPPGKNLKPGHTDNMKLLIKIKEGKVNLALFNGSKKTGSSSFTEKNNLSEKLLPEIDKLLKKNKLTPRDVKKVVVQTDTPKSFTTSRIAQAVGKAWNRAVQTLDKKYY